MPPKSHAILSASSSHRWLNCNPSARLEQEFEDQETEAAAEGTAAHALCEHKLRKALKLRSKKPVSQYDCDEMDDYTDGYVQFVLEQLAQAKLTCPDPQVLIEQRLDFSCYVPDGFGTGDCLIIASPRLHVIDFKYGLGVLVDAYQNPQMMLYALGALRIFDLIAELTGVGGYLDIGINDTMKDRLVNFLDAVIFSIVLLRQAARTGQIRRKDHTEGIDAG